MAIGSVVRNGTNIQDATKIDFFNTYNRASNSSAPAWKAPSNGWMLIQAGNNAFGNLTIPTVILVREG